MKNKKVMLAFLMLLVTAVALTTASYAWFTANTAVSLGNLDVNVTASNGIQVSMNATSWKSTLTTNEIKTTGYLNNKNQFPTTLNAVSTVGSTTTGQFDMFYGELAENGTLSTTLLEEPQSNDAAKYVAFDLFIKSSVDKTIKLNTGSGVTAVNAANSEGTINDTKLKSSSRIGFLKQGTDSTNTPATAIALAGGTKDTQVIWEPNADDHTTTAIGLGAVQGEAKAYSGVKAEGTALSLESLDTEHFAAVSTKTSTVGNLPTDTTVFNITAGITKVRIYIWIEGQDIDCENSASLGTGIRAAINLVAE